MFNDFVDATTDKIDGWVDGVKGQPLMNGYAPEQAFESGLLCTNLPFDDYKQRSAISQVAREVGDADDFSRRIRVGLPRCDA